MSRFERRLWATILGAGFIAVSIIISVTQDGPESGFEQAIHSVGTVYLSSVSILHDFAAEATIPPNAVRVIYGILGLFVWLLAGHTLDWYAFPNVAGQIAIVVGVVAVLVGAFAVVTGALPQFLVLGVFGVVLAFVIAIIP